MTHTHSSRVRALATITITTVSVAALLTLLPTIWVGIIFFVIAGFAGLFLLAMLVGAVIAAGDMDEDIQRREIEAARVQRAIEDVGEEAGNVVMLWPEDRRGDVVRFPGGEAA